MNNIVLSKDADKLLCTIYKQYLEKRKQDMSKSSASRFKFDEIRSLFPKSNNNDIATDLCELGKSETVQVFIGGDFFLTNNGVVYMENRFKNGLNEVTDFITKFIP